MSYICMIVDGNYPQDIRVRKEAEVLANSGKKILIVCPHKKGTPKKETINGVEIFRIGKNYNNSKKGIYDIIESITNINLLFYFGLQKVFKKYNISFLHVHDLPLAGTGYFFRKKVKNNIVLDLHENYPEALKTWFLWKKNVLIRFKNFLFMNPGLWSKKEKKFCQKYTKVICVVDEMKQKLITNFNINSNKLFVISNLERKDFVKNFDNEVASNIINNTIYSITYIGGFGPHRGLQTAIKAMSKIILNIPNAKLILVGKGSFEVEKKLKELVNKNKVESYVNFVGYKPFKEVATIMKLSSINIIPHLANDHTNNTIPHKLFQIMMSKSLLLVSSCKPLKRIVEKYNAGLVFEANNHLDFASKVIEIYQNPKKYDILKENAYRAAMDVENWETESKKLISLYNYPFN